MSSLSVDAEKCNKCGMCIEECPGDLIKIIGEDALPSWVRGAEIACLNCGHCVALCPTGALQLSSIPLLKCPPVAEELQATPEQLEQFLKSRRSIRAYKEESVDREKLVKLIDIARYAPSGHNGQPVQWLIIEKRDKVRELAQVTIDWLRELIQKEPEIAKSLQAKALVKRWDSRQDAITRGAPHLIFAHARKELGYLNDFNIALTYLREKRFGEAIDLYGILLEWDRGTGNRLGEAIVLNQMGWIYAGFLKKPKKAYSMYSDARDIFTELGKTEHIKVVEKNIDSLLKQVSQPPPQHPYQSE